MAVSKFESREIHARRCPDLIGEGSIVDTDVLATNVAAYPKGAPMSIPPQEECICVYGKKAELLISSILNLQIQIKPTA